MVDALEALCNLAATGSVWAKTVVDANSVTTVAELSLLESPHAKVRQGTAKICGTLGKHDFALKLILKAKLCNPLVSLLR